MSDIIPKPRSVKELQKWIGILNNQYARLKELKNARASAHAAVDAAFDVADAPHVGMRTLYEEGITAYIAEHEPALLRKFGREFDLEPGHIKVRTQAPSLETLSDAETTRILRQDGFEELIRWEPAPDRTKIKAFLADKTVPRTAKRKLRKSLARSGAYVSEHRTVSLRLPVVEKPIVLFKRRFPSIPMNGPDIDMQD